MTTQTFTSEVAKISNFQNSKNFEAEFASLKDQIGELKGKKKNLNKTLNRFSQF